MDTKRAVMKSLRVKELLFHAYYDGIFTLTLEEIEEIVELSIKAGIEKREGELK